MSRFLAPLAAVLSLHGAEYAILTTGFHIRASRHEVHGETIRLHTESGVIELPASLIAGFEPEAPRPEADRPAPAAPVAPPAPAAAAPSADPKQLLDQAAERYGLPAAFLHSVARVESAYRPDAVSPKGAIGVMQLMPETAARLRADPRDPVQNVDAGARHLRDLLAAYQGSTMKALAAYNAGAGAVERYKGVPPYPETVLYVEKVLRNYQKLSRETASK